MSFAYRTTATSAIRAVSLAAALADSQLHTLLLSIDSTSLRLRVDGQAALTATLDAPLLDCAGPATACRLILGARPTLDAPEGGDFFAGGLARARLYPDVALAAAPTSFAAGPALPAPPPPPPLSRDYNVTRLAGGADLRAALTSGTPVGLAGLVPDVAYRCLLRVTNAQGAGASPLLTARTDTAAPPTPDTPRVEAVGSTVLAAVWSDPPFFYAPFVSYTLRVAAAPDNATVAVVGSLKNNTQRIGGLLPYTQHCVFLTLVTAAGEATAAPACARTGAGSPTGVLPPVLRTLNATAILATLQPVQRNNGPQLTYRVFLAAVSAAQPSPTPDNGQAVAVYTGEFRSTLTLTGLVPGTLYRAWLQASHALSPPTLSLASLGATTLSALPTGLAAPTVVVAGARQVTVRVTAPTAPNGPVNRYTVLVDNVAAAVVAEPGNVTLTALQPYTAYNLRVEACHVHSCVTSAPTAVTTAQLAPEGVLAPNLTALSGRPVGLMATWAAPEKVNGLLRPYVLRLQRRDGCAQPQHALTAAGLVACGATQLACGAACYDPDVSACCSGTVYIAMPGHVCCGSDYMLSSADTVCCGDAAAHAQRSGHSCCSGAGGAGLYAPTATGQVCCGPDGAAGNGTHCCGSVAYTPGQGALCCADTLVPADDPTATCCGAAVLQPGQVCCRGMVFAQATGYRCCGTEYVPADDLCCESGTLARVYSAPAATAACCGLSLYDAATAVCALRAAPEPAVGDAEAVAREAGAAAVMSVTAAVDGDITVLCPLAAAATARCGQCDFNMSAQACLAWERSEAEAPLLVTPGNASFPGSPCPADIPPEAFSAPPDATSLVAQPLLPATVYAAAFEAATQGGATVVAAGEVSTSPAPPEGVDGRFAVLRVLARRVEIAYARPAAANGAANYSVIVDDDRQVFLPAPSDLTWSRSWVSGLTAARAHTVQLAVCTSAGCGVSAPVAVVTVAVPPTAATLTVAAGKRRADVAWDLLPRGEVGSQTDATLVLVAATQNENESEREPVRTVRPSSDAAAVEGLTPDAEYNVTLRVCGAVACVTTRAVFRTLAAAPTGPLLAPVLHAVTARSVYVNWTAPLTPNGALLPYTVLRDDVAIANTSDTHYTDTDAALQPFTLYTYAYVAATAGGATHSASAVVTTPPALATGITPPELAAVGQFRVDLVWEPPTAPNAAEVTYTLYRSTTAAGASESDARGVRIYAGTQRQFADTGLQADATYFYTLGVVNVVGEVLVRDAATQALRRVRATTGQALAAGVTAPAVTATSAERVQVVWTAPLLPNGAIERYAVEWRAVQTPPLAPQTLVTSASPGQLDVDDIQPYAAYEFRLAVTNGAGTVVSRYTLARTCSAAPGGVGAAEASIDTVTASAAQLSWALPTQSNGPVADMRFTLQVGAVASGGAAGAGAIQLDAGNATTITVTLLAAFTEYEAMLAACVPATCSSGSLCSTRVSRFTTADGLSQGLQPPVALVLSAARVLLQWHAPAQPNAASVSYMLYRDAALIYTGADTTFTDTGLTAGQPYEYALAALTSAGVTLALRNVTVETLALAPQGLLAPTAAVLDASSETVTVRFCWQQPSVRGADVTQYTLLLVLAGSESGSAARSEDAGLATCLTVRQLQADAAYEARVQACSPDGCVVSAATLLDTPCVPPLPVTPVLSASGAASALSLSLTWPTAAVLACSTTALTLEYANVGSGNTLSLLLPSSTVPETQVVQGLEAATDYVFRIRASNSAGSSVGGALLATTLPLPPSGVSAPTLFAVSATAVRASWPPPATPNGDIVGYRVLIGSAREVRAELGAGVQQFRIDGLQPYSVVHVSVVACTAGGCTPGPVAQVRTEEAVPADLSAPVAANVQAEAISLAWGPPSEPNGVVTGYVVEVERCGLPVMQANGTLPTEEACWPAGSVAVEPRAQLSADPNTLTMVVRDAVVQPYALHRVRVGASNSAGTFYSDWTVRYAQPCIAGDCAGDNGVRLVPLRTAAVAPEVVGKITCKVSTGGGGGRVVGREEVGERK